MTSEHMRDLLRKSVRKHVMFSYAVVFGLLGAMITWAWLTEISGAVIAQGSVVAESYNKVIQHPDGGVIDEIYVKNGDVVEVGDLLIRLDANIIKANLELASNRYIELLAERARIEADLAGRDTINFPRNQHAQLSVFGVQSVLLHQNKLLRSNRAARDRKRLQIESRISQLEALMDGMYAQQEARENEKQIVQARAADIEILFEKDLTSAGNMALARREEVRIVGALSAVQAEIARTRHELIELRMQIESIEENARAEMIERLRDLRFEIVQARLDRVQNTMLLSRVDIKAPTSGIVHDVTVHTIGGVIQPAQSLLQILPAGDDLVLEQKVRPVDVDQVFPGQSISVMFPGLNARSAPRLEGELLYVSGDLFEDPVSGQSYYALRARLAQEELDKIDDLQLIAGMPAIGFLETRRRTVLTYLIEPFKTQIQLALKEE